MLDNPLPQWVRERCLEYIEGYLEAARLARGRMAVLAATFPKRRGLLPADALGTYDDYRFDALYCNGQAERLQAYLNGRRAPAKPDPREAPTKERPFAPEKLQEWSQPWRRVDGPPLPDPNEALQLLRPHDLMEKFTPREAEALILCYGLDMKPRDAAPIMRCSPRQVSKYIQAARHKFGPNDTEGLRKVF